MGSRVDIWERSMVGGYIEARLRPPKSPSFFPPCLYISSAAIEASDTLALAAWFKDIPSVFHGFEIFIWCW